MNERKDHKEKKFQYKHTSSGGQLQSHKQTKKTRIREHPSGVSVCAHCALRHGGPVDDNAPNSDVKAHEDFADGGCCSTYFRVAADAEFAAQLRPANHEHKAEICKYLVRNFTLGFLEEGNLLWSPFVIGLVYFKVEPLDCCEATSVKLEQALLKALEKFVLQRESGEVAKVQNAGRVEPDGQRKSGSSFLDPCELLVRVGHKGRLDEGPRRSAEHDLFLLKRVLASQLR